MKIIPDWHQVLKHAWSVRFVAAIVVVQSLDAVLPLIGESLPMPDGWLPWVTAVFAVLALISRFIPQRKVSGPLPADFDGGYNG